MYLCHFLLWRGLTGHGGWALEPGTLTRSKLCVTLPHGYLIPNSQAERSTHDFAACTCWTLWLSALLPHHVRPHTCVHGHTSARKIWLDPWAFRSRREVSRRIPPRTAALGMFVPWQTPCPHRVGLAPISPERCPPPSRLIRFDIRRWPMSLCVPFADLLRLSWPDIAPMELIVLLSRSTLAVHSTHSSRRPCRSRLSPAVFRFGFSRRPYFYVFFFFALPLAWSRRFFR